MYKKHKYKPILTHPTLTQKCGDHKFAKKREISNVNVAEVVSYGYVMFFWLKTYNYIFIY